MTGRGWPPVNVRLGFTHLARVQIGGQNQEPFLDVAERRPLTFRPCHAG